MNFVVQKHCTTGGRVTCYHMSEASCLVDQIGFGGSACLFGHSIFLLSHLHDSVSAVLVLDI
jgi:hypothetical protein